MPNRLQPVASSAKSDCGPDRETGASRDSGTHSGIRWAKPVLSAYGDVRALTMGVSNPPGESGNPGARRP